MPRKSVVLAWWPAGIPGIFETASRLVELEEARAEVIVSVPESVLTPDLRDRLPAAVQIVPVPGAPSLDELRRYGMLAASGDLVLFHPCAEADASPGDWATRLERAGAGRPR